MHSFHSRQRPLEPTFRYLLLGGFALFGCSSHLEQHACDGLSQCAEQAGNSAASGSAGDSGRSGVSGESGVSGGGTAGNAAAGGTLSGVSGSQAAGTAGSTGNSGGGEMTAGGTNSNGGVGPSAGAGGTVPKLCPDGAFDHDGDPNNPCKAWARCPPGQYIAQEGTDTADRVCALCGTGTFSATQNAKACSPWTDCGPNTYLTQAGTATANQKCSACPSAQAPQANQCFPEGACLFPGACQPGTVQIAPANGSTPAQCIACSPGAYCIGGLTPEMSCASGFWDHDANPATCCSAWASCAPGKYTSKAGSASTNRECSSCDPGSFSSSSNATQCSPWKECPPASSTWPQGGVATAGTLVSDTVCAEPYYKFGTAAGDGAFAVAVDGSGNVYVAGTTYGALAGSHAGASDAFVRKFDAKGAIVWTQQFGTSTDEQGNGIAVDGSGNVYVTGRTFGGSSNGGFVRKLDASGTTLWARPFGDAAETPAAVAVDGSGNSYVAGTTYPNGQASGEAFVRKFDASGTVSWTQQFGGPSEDEAMAVAVDGSGNSYVAGYTYGLTSDAGHRDGFVRKFNSSGVALWTRQFGTAESDEVGAARVDGSGNLYLAGTSNGGLGGSVTGTADAFVRKFDPSGATLWTKQVGTSGYDYCSGLGVDGSNNVYVVGSTDNASSASSAGGDDTYVRKLDSSGATLWTKQIGTANHDEAQDAAADASGNLYIVGFDGNFLQGDAFVLQVPAQSP